MKKIILLMAICMAISGCSNNSQKKAANDKEQEQQPAVHEAQADEDTSNKEEVKEEKLSLKDELAQVMNIQDKTSLEPLEVTIHTLENSYTDNDDVIVSYVKIDYPVIKNEANEDSITKINEFFQDTAQALFEENDTYAKDNLEEVKEELVEQEVAVEDYKSEYQVTFDIKYNASGILSILQNFSERYEGQDVLNSYSTGYVFDITTGERLAIDDILLGTQQEIEQRIGQAFMDSDTIEQQLKEKYQEEILENTQYTEFYIDDTSICFFYNPNMAVPYQEGMIACTLPLHLEDIFKIELPEIN